jgi:hypothetical protein
VSDVITPIDSAELEMIAASLAQQAYRNGTVFRQALNDEFNLFAYPADALLIIGIGYVRDALQAHIVEQVLRRRGEQPERFANWLPAQFADGSFFVLRRILQSGHADGVRVPPASELADALALLAS